MFDRETAENWELGAKTSWLDRKLTLNLTFYRMDISGFQDRAFDGTSFTVRNAGNLRHQGFEFDGVAKPIHGLSLFASVAYLDSEFTDYPNAAGLPGCAPNAAGVVPAVCTAAGSEATQDLEGKPRDLRAEVERTRRLRLGRRYRLGRLTLGPELEPVVLLEAVWAASSTTRTRRRSGRLRRARRPRDAQRPGRSLVRLAVRQQPARQAIRAGNLTSSRRFARPENGVFPGSTAVRRLHADPRTYGLSGTFRF